MQDNRNKVFIDSNVLIYAYSNSEQAKQLYSEDLQHNQIIDGVLTIKNPFIK